jgi:pimeloyl-ACP methyl ester carboxylesterase
MIECAKLDRLQQSAHQHEIPRGRPVFRKLPGEPDRQYFIHVPQSARQDTPVLVLVHGISRNAIEHVTRFGQHADQAGVILVAPLFAKESYGQYQQVIDRKRNCRSDLALFDILEDVTSLCGVQTQRIYLFGFSGGGQFVHRFAMIHPDRVIACACVAAGWYTFPDKALKFPKGLGRHPVSGGVFDEARIRTIPFHVMVGAKDKARDQSLRHTLTLDALQGADRLERAKRWFAAMQAWGIHSESSFSIIARAGHNFGKAAKRRELAERVFSCLGLSSSVRSEQPQRATHGPPNS